MCRGILDSLLALKTPKRECEITYCVASPPELHSVWHPCPIGVNIYRRMDFGGPSGWESRGFRRLKEVQCD
jgi:hypothetical protein